MTERSVLLGTLVWIRNTRMVKSHPAESETNLLFSLGLDRTSQRAKTHRPCSRWLVLRTESRYYR
jgi:hypothetical protein